MNLNKKPETLESLEAEQARMNEPATGGFISAGGWCAPSETIYGSWVIGSDEILTLPQVMINRGGIRFGDV